MDIYCTYIQYPNLTNNLSPGAGSTKDRWHYPMILFNYNQNQILYRIVYGKYTPVYRVTEPD
jgi:hypothetical protein